MLSKIPNLFASSKKDDAKVKDDPKLSETSLLAEKTIESVSKIVLGKKHQIRLAVACMLADGHLLLEDVPGVGKTTLAHALKQSFGLQFARVQFTSDFLPGDV